MTAIDESLDLATQPKTKTWLVGPALGVTAVALMVGTGVGFSVTDKLPIETMLAKLEAANSTLRLGGAAQALTAMALVIFGAWVFTRLREVEPEGALTPLVAGGGCIITAAMLAMAAAHTQLIGSYVPTDIVDPAVPLALHTLAQNLFAGAWCSLALVAGAVAVAALRRRVLPTWLGGVSAFITALLLVLQIVVPWAGWFPAAIWLIVAGIGLRSRPASVGS